MKHFFLFLVLLMSLPCFAQSKKDKKVVKNHKIKSITETVTDYDNGKESTRKDSYTLYDKNANILQNEEYRKDGTLKHKEVIRYDSNGNKIEEAIFDGASVTPNPESNLKHVRKYDINDNKTEELQYDGTGKLMHKVQFSYNGKGERTFEATFDPAGKLLKKVVYTYDSRGLRVEKKEYDAENKLVTVRKYQYTF